MLRDHAIRDGGMFEPCVTTSRIRYLHFDAVSTTYRITLLSEGRTPSMWGGDLPAEASGEGGKLQDAGAMRRGNELLR